MKKHSRKRIRPLEKTTQFMTVTLFALLLMSFGPLSAYANAKNTQVQTITISPEVRGITLKEAIGILEKESGYLFTYNEDVNLNMKIDLSAQDQPIEQALNSIFSSTGVSYAIKNKHILLYNKAESKAASAKSTTGTQQSNTTITGEVIDVLGEPLIGAQISIKGGSTGTITDIDGKFSLKAEVGDVLEVNYIGYLKREIEIKNNTPLKIILKEDVKTLDEVVVIGYGTQKKTNLTGAVAALNTSDISA